MPSRRRVVGLALGFALVAGAVYELWLPARIDWEPAKLGAMRAERADGLVLQDALGVDVWASRGFAVYRSRDSQPFERVTTIAPRLGPAWAGFSRTFRGTFRYQELVEAMALDENTLLAFAGGDAYRIDVASGDAARVHRLRYFGPGRGRGLMPHGLTRDASGTIYYGEYPTGVLAHGETVRIWRSRDEGRTWGTAHEFAPGAVRHVHAVQWDAIGNALWVATGDKDAECRIGYSRDGGATFTWIGEGSQSFRAVSFLFTPLAVSWAMDSPAAPTHLVRWERATDRVDVSPQLLPSPAYYATPLGGERGLFTLAEREAGALAAARRQASRARTVARATEPVAPAPDCAAASRRRPAPPERAGLGKPVTNDLRGGRDLPARPSEARNDCGRFALTRCAGELARESCARDA